MKRASPHLPIDLAHLKKREKENTPHEPKDSIEHDLLLFQESLQIKTEKSNWHAIQSQRQAPNRVPLGEHSNFISNTQGNSQGSSKPMLREDSSHYCSAEPVMTRLEFNKNFKQMKSLHRTSASFKPKISKGGQSEVQNSDLNIEVLKVKDWRDELVEDKMKLLRKAFESKIEGLENEKIQF
jgi:hypothetical protein